MADDKTQPATPRRREQAVRDGDLWQPREIAPAAVLALATLVLALAGAAGWQRLAAWFADVMAHADDMTVGWVTPIVLAWLMGPAVIAGLAAVAAAVAVNRQVSGNVLTPRWSRISPRAGLRRILSTQGGVQALTAIAKLVLIGAAGLSALLPAVPELGTADIDDWSKMAGALLRLLVLASGAAFAIALIDAGGSWWIRERRLRMSLDEVKREQRENDGAPEVKAALKRAQYAAATRRLQSSLADAAVVVVNPIHFAVAMRYRSGVDAAPIVVEKGRLDQARAIIDVARTLKVPVVRAPRLARALFFTARRGQMVREELFAAVATVIAFVLSFDHPEQEAAPAIPVPPAFDFDERGRRRKPGVPVPL